MRIFSGVFSLLAFLLSAALQAQTLPDLKFTFKKQSLEISPPPAHHFNLQAPCEIKEGQTPLKFKLSPSTLKVQIPLQSEGKTVDVVVFICDEGRSYCLRKQQKIVIPSRGSAQVPLSTHENSISTQNTSTAKPAQPHFEKQTGFWVNDPESAFAEAKTRNLPLMIDFFGIWCPPCNHLDAMVFKSEPFVTAAQPRFVRLKLDSDSATFSPIKERYHVLGLPTLIFTTPSGDEILRLVGFQPLSEVLGKMKLVSSHPTEGYEALSKKADAGTEEAVFPAAAIAMNRGEFEKALRWLNPLEPSLIKKGDARLSEIFRAELGLAQKQDNSAKQRETIEKWTQKLPNSVDQIENYETLADLLKEAGPADASHKTLLKGLALIERLTANPNLLAGSEYTRADLAQTRADYLERLGDLQKAKTAYLECAKAYELEAQAEGGSFARGPHLERAYCLGKAGQVKESAAIYRKGIQLFPTEFTFYSGLARLWLNEGKNPQNAAQEAKRALQYAYGPQRLKCVWTQVKALEALGDLKGAIRAVDEEVNPAAPPSLYGSASASRLSKKLLCLRTELEKKLNSAHK
ncbi:thioredoxin family protein [Bdellovibrionota bacterium FG-1]